MPPRLLSFALLPWLALAVHAEQPPATLRAAYSNAFLIGAALDTSKVNGGNPRAAEIVARQFTSITAENDMKWSAIHPEPDRYNFRPADAYVDFGARHTMAVIGHTLVWHNQTPPWVFLGDDGKPATRELLLRRLRDHIHTVVGRYKGRVKGWDVVNEAVGDNGPDVLRDSPWHRIIGDDYLDHAFRFAREADPRAELYYNDYGLFNREKRARTVRMLRGLIARGVPIDGVGLQGHYQINYPPVAEIEQAILDFSALGLKVMITELDVDMLPSRGQIGVADIARREDYEAALNPWVNGLPASEQARLAQRYGDLFALFLKHRKTITRVTFWGLDDGQSWLNNFPVPGRTNHPLLFDRQLDPKPAFRAVLDAAR